MKTIQRLTVFSAMLMFCLSVFTLGAQTITVSGRVTDAGDHTPIIGASVGVRGTSRGTVTDIDGKYSIEARKGEQLIFSYIGYKEQRIKVTTAILNIRMEPDHEELAEMVVVAYGTQVNAISDASLKAGTYSAAASPMLFSRMIQPEFINTESYNSLTENGFRNSFRDPLSTFSIDVDAASYSNMRRFVNNGSLPPANAIRTEELVNYFSYDYPAPTGKDPVHISAETGDCPWNNDHRLVKIGLKAKEIAGENFPASNLVFLIDVSGSMWGPTRLDLVKSSLKLLVNNLREKDQVAIVVYAGSAGEVLPSTSGSDKQKIREALDQLTAGGSTAGGAGIQLAYKIAEKNFIKGGNNRIILCTDGDFNVGVSSKDGLERLIEEKRQTGVFLTVLGYGMGNYKDDRMQILAEKGNGNYAYIDNLQEANKVLVNEFGGTLFTVAKDVKLQIEFNPVKVQAYRLIGYESRLLNSEDFNNDAKDAGEMGAGHTVTAFYEIIPAGIESTFTATIDPLKYQQPAQQESIRLTGSPELVTIKLRYKDPDGEVSRKIELPVIDNKTTSVSSDFRFAAAVALYGQLLSNSEFTRGSNYDKVLELARKSIGTDPYGYRREFIRLVEAVNNLTLN
ncbi:MAG: von Willebrand factor type A domain-containing protein [Bacteroides sp.]|nr:von Willebrand factor type A domain-containing protein [Bacteroides sp.]